MLPIKSSAGRPSRFREKNKGATPASSPFCVRPVTTSSSASGHSPPPRCSHHARWYSARRNGTRLTLFSSSAFHSSRKVSKMTGSRCNSIFIQPFLHLFQSGRGGCAAARRGRKPAADVPPAQTLLERPAIQPGLHETGVERIACASRVHDFNRHGRGVKRFTAADGVRAVRPVLDHDERAHLAEAAQGFERGLRP